MIALARKTLIYEWRRFLPAILATGFAGVLLTVQAALVLGIFGSAAVYVTESSADLWAGYPGTQSVNFGRAIGPDVEIRLRMDPDVTEVEPYLWLEGDWHNVQRSGGGISVFVSGIDPRREGLMFSHLLSAGLRHQLEEPNAVIVDRAELDQLGTDLDHMAWINGQQVHVIAAIAGLRGLGGINVLASLDTVRLLQGADGASGDVTYYVAKVRPSAEVSAVQARLVSDPSFGPFEVWTAPQFAARSQWYWMFDTGAGVAVLFMAAIVCLVGAVITSQSLMAMVIASAREYAVLNALGVSLSALGRVVLEQSCWIGSLGLITAGLFSSVLLSIASAHDVPVAMTLPVALACIGLVLGLAILSGFIAMRGLLQADPTLLLR